MQSCHWVYEHYHGDTKSPRWLRYGNAVLAHNEMMLGMIRMMVAILTMNMVMMKMMELEGGGVEQNRAYKSTLLPWGRVGGAVVGIAIAIHDATKLARL